MSQGGDLGVIYGRWSASGAGPEGAENDHGYYINVLEKIDGQWKNIMELNGSSTP